MNLIRLTSENQTALGLDSPWLVEVVMSKGMPIPPFVMESSLVGLAGSWTAVAPCGDMTWDIDGPSDYRRARPATEQEIRDAHPHEITGDVLTASGDGGAERPASPEALPDETAPPALGDAVPCCPGGIGSDGSMRWVKPLSNT